MEPNMQTTHWYERPLPVIGLMIGIGFGLFILTLFWHTITYYHAFATKNANGLPQFAQQFSVTNSVVQASTVANDQVLLIPTAPHLGDDHAPITIVEFGDFGCPYTKDVFPSIRTIAQLHSSSVRYLWRDFPIESLHPNARNAAIAARCADAQGKFWQYHDVLFTNQTAIDDTSLEQYAAGIGLDTAAFHTCLSQAAPAPLVDNDAALARSLGLRGTPTFYINGAKVEGAIPYQILSDIVAKLAK